MTHGTIKFIGLFDTADACFAAVNASKDGPFHSFTWNDATVKAPYVRHCWADTSMTWQGRGGAKGQVSGRGPGFPLVPKPPSTFTHDHLTGLREVAYDPDLKTLVSNPVKELVQLRNGSLASEKAVKLSPGTPHLVAGTGAPADASTSDVVVNVTVPSSAGSVGVHVLANASGGSPFGGILTYVNFTKAGADGSMQASASILTLDPCGGPSTDHPTTVSFPILKGETVVDIRLLVDRSVVEVFVMGGRESTRWFGRLSLFFSLLDITSVALRRAGVVFSKLYAPKLLYVPDTHVALQAWGTAVTASVDVHSMGCGWTAEPYQTHPTVDSVSNF